jgi:hypothetical protein
VPVFIPFWTFDARTATAWRALVLQPESKRLNRDFRMLYEANKEVWNRDPATINRYLDKFSASGDANTWKWESGVVNRFFDDFVVSGTTRLSKRLLEQIEQYDLHDLQEYEPKFLAGQQAQAYDLPLDEAWQTARHKMRELIRLECRFQGSTPTMRNFSMNLNFNEESWRYILLPVYIAVYHYRGQVFQVMINGQSGAISGQRPVDWLIVWLAVIATMVPAMLIALIGILFQTFGDGSSWFIMAFFAALVGAAASVGIVRTARAMDDV